MSRNYTECKSVCFLILLSVAKKEYKLFSDVLSVFKNKILKIKFWLITTLNFIAVIQESISVPKV